ncbi:MAG: precorrin-4 C(11)-methyltransferase [Draconibacterium sp.]|nr:MAG: precorrin-4 C(11)-methyltransferase [Draconibacterium sp.]
MITIITHSQKGEDLAKKIINKGFEANFVRSPKNYQQLWQENTALIFIGALGICVREIAPFLNNKKTDPAVINIDANGQFVQPVVSGHVGGANQLAKTIASILGATPVVTTVSDTSNLWALDLLAQQFDWQMECCGQLNRIIADFVNAKPTALLLDIRDKGTLFLETECPEHVQVFFDAKAININLFDVIIAVTPYIYNFGNKAVYYRPKAIHVGIGCQRNLPTQPFMSLLEEALKSHHISPLSVAAIGTVDIKKDEQAIIDLAAQWKVPMHAFDSEVLAKYKIPNPSDKVKQETGSRSVSEAAAMHLSGNELLCEKTKGKSGEKFFTYAVAIAKNYERKGLVEFLGAGPGDPELVSVRGKRMLQTADYILYAGSLVPKELTAYAKSGCVVESSAGMDLQTQIASMQPYYERGLFIVRLHTGDPCIYGAIQEQMTEMDKLEWNYHITPGISSFQAAAAALKSQFTIPEEVQTIILTRGEGRTPMPEREQLQKLAKSQSTMCIYLSAAIADKIEKQLLEHYPKDTPVAVCYKLTWKEEKIYRCKLVDLAKTVAEHQLKMTTLIVVGKAIDNRSGKSKLYHQKFTHAFREGVD